jgi:uncharacterized protein
MTEMAKRIITNNANQEEIMMQTYLGRLFLVVSFITGMLSCSPAAYEMSPREYAAHIAEWDSERLQRLRSPDGWLNLAGLFWLQEGENSVGSDPGNDIVFPRGPGQIGTVKLEGNNAVFHPSGETGIKADGKKVSGQIRISGDEREAELLTVDSLAFFIIRRGERTGIRLRDYTNPRLEALQHVDRYPADQEWIIKARYIRSEQELTVMVPDVLGEIRRERVPGILEFEMGGELQRLYPTGSGERLFIIFADDTNAEGTYGGGRFLYADPPGEDGYVYLDFNKAYNPPCAFTPYTTCPLPPRENFLPLAIEAGEKVPDLP